MSLMHKLVHARIGPVRVDGQSEVLGDGITARVRRFPSSPPLERIFGVVHQSENQVDRRQNAGAQSIVGFANRFAGPEV
jgi:hypothetical protein